VDKGVGSMGKFRFNQRNFGRWRENDVKENKKSWGLWV
jgi:hypothetical protein